MLCLTRTLFWLMLYIKSKQSLCHIGWYEHVSRSKPGPLCKVCTAYPTCQCIIFQAVDPGTVLCCLCQFANLHVGLFLGSACFLSHGVLPKTIFVIFVFVVWFVLSVVLSGNWFKVNVMGTCQLVASQWFSQWMNLKLCFQIRVVSLSFQEDLPLPSLVEIESSNHYTKHLLNPDDRQISSTCQAQMTGNRQICFSVLLLLCLNQASIISDNLSFPDIMDLALGSVQSCSLSQVCLKCDNWTHV